MDDRKEKNAPWLSVPQFGDWDQKGQVPDYSLDFSKIREMRKQNKRDVSRASLGNEEELIASNTAPVDAPHPQYHQRHHSPTARRSIFSYFNCCVRACCLLHLVFMSWIVSALCTACMLPWLLTKPSHAYDARCLAACTALVQESLLRWAEKIKVEF